MMRLLGDRRTILPTFGKGLSKVKVNAGEIFGSTIRLISYFRTKDLGEFFFFGGMYSFKVNISAH